MFIPVRIPALGSVLVLGLLAGCASQPTRIPPQSFAPGLSAPTPPPAHEIQLVNDPSAPPNKPRGRAAARDTTA
ncbi:MAG: hypothetical protein ABF637_08260, partial [Acetobacter fabarum]